MPLKIENKTSQDVRNYETNLINNSSRRMISKLAIISHNIEFIHIGIGRIPFNAEVVSLDERHHIIELLIIDIIDHRAVDLHRVDFRSSRVRIELIEELMDFRGRASVEVVDELL